MECVILIGAQASGKSTFFRARFFRTHVRINLDMLRTRHREARLLESCLEMQQPFVVDNTNPSREDRSRYIAPARLAGFRVSGYYFQSRIDDVLRRNLGRPEDERIPEPGIRGTHARLERPRMDEGFDSLHYVSLLDPDGFRVDEWIDEV
ncbi:MAG: kinase [Planctomycetes bacterium]|jgi:predicted kinase|nr:kinase [Planctomycetota bacterium]